MDGSVGRATRWVALVAVLSALACSDSDKDKPSGSKPPDASTADSGSKDSSAKITGDTSKGPANAWLRMGYDHTNTYFNPVEKTISVDSAPKLQLKWSFEVAGYPPGSPVVVNGRVYAMATGGLYAIDLETGAEVWSRTDIVGTSSVAYQDNAIYVHANATGDKLVGQLHKLNADDGTTIWGPIVTYDLGNCDGTSSPMLADGKVLVGHGCGVRELATDGTNMGPRGGVEAFSQETGDHVWTYWSVPETGEDGAMSWSTQSIDFDEKTVYLATGNNYTQGGPHSDAIHKIKLETGERIWSTQVREGDIWGLAQGNTKDTDFGANPILANVGDKKIVADGDKGAAFWALDRDSGDILWSREMLTQSRGPATGGILNNGAFDGKNFYVASNDPASKSSTLFKLDPLSGEDVWTKHFDKIVWGAMSLANGVLVAPINDDLYILNAETGEQLNMFNTGGTIAGGAAAIVQGKIIVKSGLSYALSNTINNNKILCYALPSDATPVADAGAAAAPGAPTFSAVYKEIISGTGCNGGGTCHGSDVAGSLKMANQADAYKALVGVKAMGTNLSGGGTDCKSTDFTRVVANDPTNSLLFRKVDDAMPPCGDRMPIGGMLKPAQIDQIKQWIMTGAKND